MGDFLIATIQNANFVGGDAEQVVLTVYAQSIENCFIKSKDTLAINYLPNELCFITDSITPVAGSLYIPGVLSKNSLWEWTNNPGDLSVLLFDAAGRIVYEAKQYKNNLNSSEISPGYYMYSIYHNHYLFKNGKLWAE